MNKFDISTIKDLKTEREKDDDYTSYIVDNGEVFIAVKVLDNNTLDLDRFYSRVDIKGLARCTLYYILRELIAKIPTINLNSLIEISIIAPSLPKRNIETIQRTYRNMGWSNIKCQTSCGMSEKEFKKKVAEDPYFKDAKDILCQDAEICSAIGEPICKILEALKFCDSTAPSKFCENGLSPKRKYSDEELLENVPEDVGSISSQELLNYEESEDEEIENQSKRQKSRKGGKHKKARKGGKNKKTIKRFSKFKK